VHADSERRLLVIEHYRNHGLLTTVTAAASAADGYASVLAAGLVSRLDHAAYLGRELARAEHALASGTATGRTPRPDKPAAIAYCPLDPGLARPS
jgi:tetrahydromethanopterin S-methyltransferase subunit A